MTRPADQSTGECDGVVRSWQDEEGWGVIDSPQTPGGCWAHFSLLQMDGYRTLEAGAGVHLQWETARQDGYSYRAVKVISTRPGAGS